MFAWQLKIDFDTKIQMRSNLHSTALSGSEAKRIWKKKSHFQRRMHQLNPLVKRYSSIDNVARIANKTSSKYSQLWIGMFIFRVINVKAAIFVDGSPVGLKLPKNIKKKHTH